MKRMVKVAPLMLSLLLLTQLYAQEEPEDIPVLAGEYLGQNLSGTTAQPFAFHIFDPLYGSFHSSVVFSPDGNNMYWQAGLDDRTRLQGIFESKYGEGRWTEPQVAFFSSLTATGVDDAPFISPNGDRFFFLSCRPIGTGGKCGKWNIWAMHRAESGWSPPHPLPPVVNSLEGIHWQLSADRDANLFFGTWLRHSGGGYTGDIYVTRYEAGGYTTPEKLGPEINVPGCYNRSPFISPDGSYLLYNSGNATMPTRMLVSFRLRDGVWSEPIDLSAKVGRQGWNPIVTIDGRFLFFLTTDRGKIRPFWMDARFIDEMRNGELDDPRNR